jgi:Holliday junction resolvase RusA-like endonuclease
MPKPLPKRLAGGVRSAQTFGVMNTTDSPPTVPSALTDEHLDVCLVRTQLLQEYVRHTGRLLTAPEPTDTELEQVASWMNKNAETFSHLLLRRRSRLVPAFSATLSQKVSQLAQFHCPLCSHTPTGIPSSTIPIRIPPISKQSAAQARGKVKAFEAAIAHRFKGRAPHLPASARVCLLIVFVVSRKRRKRDLDNMAKAVVDALKNVLFGDDRGIDHLNLLRIESPDEEYVYVNVRESSLNDHSDVLLPRMHHSWGGAEVLDLAKFMPTAAP